MEAMSERERFENGNLPRDFEIPPHLKKYLAELVLDLDFT